MPLRLLRFDRLSLYLRVPRLPCSPLLPYTTLFRSLRLPVVEKQDRPRPVRRDSMLDAPDTLPLEGHAGRRGKRLVCHFDGTVIRSEEHTSELQSRENLVCRLLLEKKTTCG